jgi:hypothetical protein
VRVTDIFHGLGLVLLVYWLFSAGFALSQLGMAVYLLASWYMSYVARDLFQIASSYRRTLEAIQPVLHLLKEELHRAGLETKKPAEAGSGGDSTSVG